MVARAPSQIAGPFEVGARGRSRIGPGATVESYLGAWLGHVKARVRARTHQGYETLIHLYALPHLGEIPLEALQPLDMQDAYANLLEREPPLSAGTVLNLHLVLHNAFGQAVRWGLIPANPVAGAQPPRPKRREPRVIDAELARRILAAAEGTTLEVPTAIALATGMRRGEILGLRWSDLDQDLTVAHVRRTLQTTKAGLVLEEPKTRRSRRAVALPSFLRPTSSDSGSIRRPDARDWAPPGRTMTPSSIRAAGRRSVPTHSVPRGRGSSRRPSFRTSASTTSAMPTRRSCSCRASTRRSSPSDADTRASASRSIPTHTFSRDAR